MKIVFLESHLITLNNDIDYSKLKALGQYSQYELTLDDDPVPYAKGAEIVIAHKILMTRERIETLKPELKLICVAATGYNNIDIEAARSFGVHVSNVAEYAKYSVAQQVFAYILNFATKMMVYDADVKKGLWQKSKTFDLLLYPTFELYEKNLGIIGFGSIGQEIAKIGAGFRMVVMPFDILDISKAGYKKYSINEILRLSDIIVVTCPLTDKTSNLINSDAFNKMKKDAILINAARGSIVNELDLYNVLKEKKISGAGFDVLSKEPPVDGNILIDKGLENLILTPHTAWSTLESRQRLVDMIAKDISDYISGKKVEFII